MGTQARHSVWGSLGYEGTRVVENESRPQGLSEGRKLSLQVLFF